MQNGKENNIGQGLSLNTIYNMDCIEGMKLIPDGSIDCIITSPPYNIGNMHSNSNKYGTYQGNNMPEEEYQAWQIVFLNQCYRILKSDGSIFYNHKVRIRDGYAIHPIQWLLKSGFVLKQEIVWDLGKSANSDKIRFFPYSERIYRMTKDPKTKLNNVNNYSDVWRVIPKHKRKETGHIAVMPEEIVKIILHSTDYKTILDPFMGSGTTAIACIDTNRNYIGFELDEGYRNIATKRIQDRLSEK